MTDTTATTNNPTLWLPVEIWPMIVNLLSPDELMALSLVCKTFHRAVTDDVILQPLYNRLYALDKTLPSALLKQDAALAFKRAFEKIQARQQQEITYLTQYHPAVMAKPEYVQALQENSSVLLKSLEAKNALLDVINSEIITARININSTGLYLNGVHITRLPVTLFQADGYVNFWKNLTALYCANNQLTALNVQGLVALQELYCSNNQLTALNVQGLVALQKLECNNNQLTALNVQGLVALQWLTCYNNQLTALNVKGLVALQLLHCDNNKLTALNVQGLVALGVLNCDNNKLTMLNVQGLVALQQLCCENNQLTALDVQGLMALQELRCSDNQLTALNVQGLVALKVLNCHGNPLNDLNLTGVSAAIKNRFAELERSLLFKRLSASDSFQTRQAIIAKLGADYTYKNCFYYCPVYAAKLFISDLSSQVYNLASSALSQNGAYLPSFGTNNNSPANPQQKRARDKEQEPNDEPEAKRRKKS